MEIDAAASVLDHGRVEARLAHIQGRPRHAKIRRQTAHEDAGDSRFLQVTGEAGGGATIGLVEGCIAVETLMKALRCPLSTLPGEFLYIGDGVGDGVNLES
jgi:hypothetical protein